MELPAFLLPAILATFSLAFGIVWWKGSKPAFWWMLAYAAQGVAYLGEILPTIFHETIDTMVVDALFVIGFVGFAQASCLYFGWPRRMAVGLCLAVITCAVDAWQIFVTHSLKGELLAIDWGLAILVLAPFLFDLRRLPASTIDRAMIAGMSATVLNCVTVSTLFAIVGDGRAGFDTYMDTGYVAASYAVTSFLNVVVPLVQLTAVALRVISDHRTASEIDMLTGLLNRRGFERACQDHSRGQRGVVVTCDIDRFKRINDGFGHATGDVVISILAAAMTASLPKDAVAARFGGEEFVAFLPHVPVADAVAHARTVAADFSARIAERLAIPFAVTSSFGVATVTALASTIHEDLKRADRALYAAKLAGRNRVMVDSEAIDAGTVRAPHALPPELRVVA